VKLGLHIPETSWEGGAPHLGARLRDVVQAAEVAGFDMIAVADHVWLHPIMGGPLQNHVEAYTTLGFIAAHTEHVRLMAMATAASYRPAGLLAKIVTTLDVLSGGRAMLGIGSGDYREEAEGLGLPFPPTAGERFDLLEETIRACLEMWEGEQGSERAFPGSHVRLGRALNLPQSLSRPHPPILIAGGGEKRTLPLVARYGDACNIPPSPEIPQKLELLRRLCEQEGRDYDAIEKTAPFGFDVGEGGSKAGEVIGQLKWLAGMGIETVIGWVVGVDRLAPIEVMAREVIPAARDLVPAA
jgi:alkanesulfonate monooxygenase SsuD/methylene tetrahydromethanopterin reductase-like flavin-dependent oxidoreductase (luciferase family)